MSKFTSWSRGLKTLLKPPRPLRGNSSTKFTPCSAHLGDVHPWVGLRNSHGEIWWEHVSLQENYNTPLEHTPGNPPSQLWKERFRGVFQRCVEITFDSRGLRAILTMLVWNESTKKHMKKTDINKLLAFIVPPFLGIVNSHPSMDMAFFRKEKPYKPSIWHYYLLGKICIYIVWQKKHQNSIQNIKHIKHNHLDFYFNLETKPYLFFPR